MTGAQPCAAAGAAAGLAAVLGHTEDLPAAARCPHTPLGGKGCAGGEGTRAQTAAGSALTAPTGAVAR